MRALYIGVVVFIASQTLRTLSGARRFATFEWRGWAWMAVLVALVNFGIWIGAKGWLR